MQHFASKSRTVLSPALIFKTELERGTHVLLKHPRLLFYYPQRSMTIIIKTVKHKRDLNYCSGQYDARRLHFTLHGTVAIGRFADFKFETFCVSSDISVSLWCYRGSQKYNGVVPSGVTRGLNQGGKLTEGGPLVIVGGPLAITQKKR